MKKHGKQKSKKFISYKEHKWIITIEYMS
jgi:hypothetical protein